MVNYKHVDGLAYDFIIMDNGKRVSISEDREGRSVNSTVRWRTLFMLIDNWLMGAVDILPTVFTAYIFFFYFNIFFEKKKRSIRVLTGIIVFVFWQLSIPEIVRILPAARNIGVTVGVTLFAVISIFEGKIWKKCFFVIIFDAVWMLVETLVNNLLMLYCEYLAVSQRFGALFQNCSFWQ